VLQQMEYPSDLTEQQWDLIKDLLPKPRHGGRPRTIDVREVINAIFYINRTGCPWRYLPKSFPKWKTTYDYFTRWQAQGVWTQICASFAKAVRLQDGREASPSVVILDSQSAKAPSGECRGYDGYKKVKGRKRHILVDTLGITHGVKVTEASCGDSRPGMALMLEKESFLKQRELSAVYVDGGYREFFQWQVFAVFGVKPTILKSKKVLAKTNRPQDNHAKQFKITKSNLGPKRWIVERTFAWFNNYRRLAKDFEKKIRHSEAMIQIAMSQILLKRLSISCC
jgi:putative transposase